MQDGAGKPSSPKDWLLEHGDALFRYAYLKLRDRDAAEDAVQETLLAALRSRETFEGNASERTWLVGILKHKVADHWRRLARSPLQTPEQEDALDALFDETGHWRVPPSRWEDPDSALEDKQFWRVLAECLEALPPAQAQAFALCEVDGVDGAQACKALDVTPTNLWVILHRARVRLRQCLERQWFGRDST